MIPAAIRAAWARPGRLAGRVLVAFALYAAAMELGRSVGLVGVVASPGGAALLVASGLLLLAAAVRELRAEGPRPARAARALALGGAGLVLAAVPASFHLRETRGYQVGEGMTLPSGAIPGLGAVTVDAITLLPRGPHVLSKTVTVALREAGEPPVEVGLFPPARVGGWHISVMRFGYAVGISLRDAAGTPIEEAYVMLGTLPHTEEEAALVAWAPETNLMMGAGTFPPKLEELIAARGGDGGGDRHVFVRLEEATIAGQRRDLRDPDAHRWLVDGRLEDALLFVQVFDGKAKLWEGRVRAGETAALPSGVLELAPDVLLWADLVASRDPALPWAVGGLGLGLAGAALGAALGAARVARRLASGWSAR